MRQLFRQGATGVAQPHKEVNAWGASEDTTEVPAAWGNTILELGLVGNWGTATEVKVSQGKLEPQVKRVVRQLT